MRGHEITVAALRKLLDELRDDDVLIANAVGNLRIVRGDKSIGWVDLADERVEMTSDYSAREPDSR